jgi:hypothetical protein
MLDIEAYIEFKFYLNYFRNINYVIHDIGLISSDTLEIQLDFL